MTGNRGQSSDMAVPKVEDTMDIDGMVGNTAVRLSVPTPPLGDGAEDSSSSDSSSTRRICQWKKLAEC